MLRGDVIHFGLLPARPSCFAQQSHLLILLSAKALTHFAESNYSSVRCYFSPAMYSVRPFGPRAAQACINAASGQSMDGAAFWNLAIQTAHICGFGLKVGCGVGSVL